jgi:hypothetical protein
MHLHFSGQCGPAVSLYSTCFGQAKILETVYKHLDFNQTIKEL